MAPSIRCMLGCGVLTLLVSQPAAGQGPELQFDLCVKQFDDFRDRFNGRITLPKDTMNAPPPPDRATLLHSLIGKDLDPVTAEAFIGSIMGAEPAYELKLDNEPWFSHVMCEVEDTVEQYGIQFWLVREKRGLIRKWSILSSDIPQETAGRRPFISSRNHETGFTDLLKTDILAHHGVEPYVGPPGIASLFALQEKLSGGAWSITAVTEVRMHLLQVPGWFVEVEYRPPPTTDGWITSGWNIIQLKPMSDGEKTNYIWRNVLGL